MLSSWVRMPSARCYWRVGASFLIDPAPATRLPGVIGTASAHSGVPFSCPRSPHPLIGGRQTPTFPGDRGRVSGERGPAPVDSIYDAAEYVRRDGGRIMRRVFLAAGVVVSLSMSASVAAVIAPAPAWAGSSLTCKTLTGYTTGSHKFHLKKCMPPNTEKTLTGLGIDLTTVGGPITDTWKWNGGATTIVSLTVAPTAGVCGAGYTGYTDTGTVIGGTSTYTNVNDMVSIVLCKKSAMPYRYELRLARGTTASL